MTAPVSTTPGDEAGVKTRPPAGNTLQLVLNTGAFLVCFAVFGSVSAMMPILKKRLGLEPLQVSLALAVPVLLGSLGRIPLGILSDRYGGRLVFSLVMLGSIIPAVLMGWVETYPQLIACGFFIGLALASFSVGVGSVSRWYPPHRQGTAIGVYGAGNVGQSLASFGAPVLAGWLGYVWGFWTFAALTFGWLVLYVLLARDAPGPRVDRRLSEFLHPLADSRSWVLSLYYFLTFGGFVAMAVYLPTFLTEIFELEPSDAGRRTAGFVVLATLARPIGGWLADRVGGRRILAWVFPATAVMALFLACPMMTTFTIGALGMALAIGLGNGAVFKLVPEDFPRAVGSVTGLVGAAGGLGGFFPPLVLGAIRHSTGSYTWGFVLLSLFSAACLLVLALTGSRSTRREPVPARV
ncbi:MFS transporter [Planctomyces sp. SH-PL62]|uniref:MFS transporter n=1 Tax=Planctomyces sp. SH-PL62 TaxID=1636152 RepID=UPI00078C1346|nr:MFS transporter [Planctomyces sp. SH-PL62]AMV37796.1 putative nitrate transporter NarT [Planctomyces sp. SH-PL62]